jgi:hypothetical protein
MNIVIIKVRNETLKRCAYQRPSPLQFSYKRWLDDRVFGVHDARRRKLPRGPQLKNELFYIHFFRHARSQESD